MKKLYILTALATLAFAVPAISADRSAGSAGPSVSEKSSPSHEASTGDKRDCLYAAFGSKGENWHEASTTHVNWVLKKCLGCKVISAK